MIFQLFLPFSFVRLNIWVLYFSLKGAWILFSDLLQRGKEQVSTLVTIHYRSQSESQLHQFPIVWSCQVTDLFWVAIWRWWYPSKFLWKLGEIHTYTHHELVLYQKLALILYAIWLLLEFFVVTLEVILKLLTLIKLIKTVKFSKWDYINNTTKIKTVNTLSK